MYAVELLMLGYQEVLASHILPKHPPGLFLNYSIQWLVGLVVLKLQTRIPQEIGLSRKREVQMGEPLCALPPNCFEHQQCGQMPSSQTHIERFCCTALSQHPEVLRVPRVSKAH